MIKTFWLIVPLAAAVIGSGITAVPAGAQEHTISNSLALAGNNSVDIWTLKCNAPASKCAAVSICDDGTLDDVMVLTVVGYAPLAIVGKGDIATSAAGGCTSLTQVCRATAGPLKVIFTVSVASNGATDYTGQALCLDKNGFALAPGTHTVTLVTNQ